VLTGPRQVGKTTLARQVMEEAPFPAHYASADEPTLQGGVWVEQQWEIARMKTKAGGDEGRESPKSSGNCGLHPGVQAATLPSRRRAGDSSARVFLHSGARLSLSSRIKTLDQVFD